MAFLENYSILVAFVNSPIRHGWESIYLLNRNDAERILPEEDRKDLEPAEHELFAHPIREFFTPEEQYVINFAVFWHAEKKVPEPKPNDPEYKKLAYKICYILRDNDKKDIFLDDIYFNLDGVYPQVTRHYLPPEAGTLLTQNPLASSEAKSVMGVLLKGNQPPEVSQLDPDLLHRIVDVFNRGFSKKAWDSFLNRESIDIKEVPYSWANYMLLHLAMMFDVKTRSMLTEIYENPGKYLDSRLKFIELKAGPEQAKAARDILMGYLQEKLAA